MKMNTFSKIALSILAVACTSYSNMALANACLTGGAAKSIFSFTIQNNLPGNMQLNWIQTENPDNSQQNSNGIKGWYLCNLFGISHITGSANRFAFYTPSSSTKGTTGDQGDTGTMTNNKTGDDFAWNTDSDKMALLLTTENDQHTLFALNDQNDTAHFGTGMQLIAGNQNIINQLSLNQEGEKLSFIKSKFESGSKTLPGLQVELIAKNIDISNGGTGGKYNIYRVTVPGVTWEASISNVNPLKTIPNMLPIHSSLTIKPDLIGADNNSNKWTNIGWLVPNSKATATNPLQGEKIGYKMGDSVFYFAEPSGQYQKLNAQHAVFSQIQRYQNTGATIPSTDDGNVLPPCIGTVCPIINKISIQPVAYAGTRVINNFNNQLPIKISIQYTDQHGCVGIINGQENHNILGTDNYCLLHPETPFHPELSWLYQKLYFYHLDANANNSNFVNNLEPINKTNPTLAENNYLGVSPLAGPYVSPYPKGSQPNFYVNALYFITPDSKTQSIDTTLTANLVYTRPESNGSSTTAYKSGKLQMSVVYPSTSHAGKPLFSYHSGTISAVQDQPAKDNNPQIILNPTSLNTAGPQQHIAMPDKASQNNLAITYTPTYYEYSNQQNNKIIRKNTLPLRVITRFYGAILYSKNPGTSQCPTPLTGMARLGGGIGLSASGNQLNIVSSHLFTPKFNCPLTSSDINVSATIVDNYGNVYSYPQIIEPYASPKKTLHGAK